MRRHQTTGGIGEGTANGTKPPRRRRRQQSVSWAAPSKTHIRAKIIGEIIGTEERYVADMKIIEEVYQAGLRNVISPEDFNTLFRNIHQIAVANQHFLSDLEVATVENVLDVGARTGAVCEVFSAFEPVFKSFCECHL